MARSEISSSVKKSMKKSYLFILLLITLIYLTWSAVNSDRFFYDLAITRWVQGFDVERVLGQLVHYNDRMGVAGVAGITGLGIIVFLWFKKRRIEAAAVSTVGIADLLNPFLRMIIDRPRPGEDLVIVYRISDSFSFPSGTAMHVMMFCGILLYFSGRLIKPGLWRNVLQTLLVIYIPFMGLWLIHRGCHWFSDVLGGYVYGIFFLWIIIWIYQKYVIWRSLYPSEQLPQEALPLFLRPFAPIFTLLR
ncbi:phosphatase PAP2 family protein [Chloroflexota bacterium]